MMQTGGFTDEVWQVKIHNAESTAYDSVDLKNIIFPYWIVSFIVHGCLEVTDGSIGQLAQSGQVMVHAPGIPFGERSLKPGHHKWLRLEAVNNYGIDMLRLFPVPEVVTLSDPAEFSRLLDVIMATHNQPRSAFRELMQCGLALQLLCNLLRDWDHGGRITRRSQSAKKDERLDAVMTHLITHSAQKISREMLAELVHLNPNYLDCIFEERFKMKPMQVLREIRLKEARCMLEISDRSLTEIAELCGMGDASYLSKKFFVSYGITPGKYREGMRPISKSYYNNGM